MDKFDLFNSLNEIDDATLLSTEQPNKRRIKYPLIKAIAACLALVICGLGLYFHLRKPAPGDITAPWFGITAYAENGVMEELQLNCSIANSYESKTNIFGNQKPLFNFDIKPKKAAEGQESFSIYDCEIFVSYNGNQLDFRGDDHIMIAYTMTAIGYPGYHSSPGYSVIGWFDAPTTLIVSISDCDTGELLEKYSVLVTPIPETEIYELTVLEIKSYDQQN